MASSIGVITLSRNQGKYLLEAIDSILAEKPAKYIVYDCGSIDNSRQIIESKKSSILQTIYVDSDNGPADGLNFALQQLDQDIFYYLNADDRVLAGVFPFVIRYFSENPGCDILHGSIHVINASGSVVRVLPSMKFSLKGYAFGYSVVYQQATFIRTRVLREVKFNVDNRISWDGELIADLAIRGFNIHRTRKVLGEFRIHDESITGSSSYKYLVKQQRKKIAIKIIGHTPAFPELFFAVVIRFFRAILRRILPRIEYVK